MNTRSRIVILALLAALVAASCTRIDVAYLAHDSLGGRDDGTPGSEAARRYIIDVLSLFAEGHDDGATGDAAFEQSFPGGTNVIGVVPGTDLADEYVVVGAHYDHLGTRCTSVEPGDTICNGATDNAAGVSAALSILRRIGLRGVTPRRTLLFAFWDREEDGLLGAAHYVDNPVVPLEDTVAYVNFDIQGANLLPSLRDMSFAVAPETGGAPLVDAVASAVDGEPLDTKLVSSIFGQFRSDYAEFVGGEVPSVFFTDSTGPCYHTTGDEYEVVDFDKLDQQIRIGLDVVEQLADGSVTPAFDGGAPLATFDDAVAILDVVDRGLADLDRFSPDDQATLTSFAEQLDIIVAEGESAFEGDDVNALLLGTVDVVAILTNGECDGFLEDPAPSGSFDALSYNVAGLPEQLSGSSPATNTPLIAPLLNDYDLVLLQESWRTPEPNSLAPLRVYHEILEAGSTHAFKSVPAPQPLGEDPSRPTAQLSDGLNRFAEYPSTPVDRVAWTECSGVVDSASDCLAFKGFSHSVITLAEGVEVDVYNLHAEAGGLPLDDALRAQDMDELAAYITTNSADRPLIVGGDFNLHLDDPVDASTMASLRSATGLVDACTTLECPDPHDIDRFLYRSSDDLTIEPTLWRFETDTFVDGSGAPLSDHDPLHVRFAWSVPG